MGAPITDYVKDPERLKGRTIEGKYPVGLVEDVQPPSPVLSPRRFQWDLYYEIKSGQIYKVARVSRERLLKIQCQMEAASFLEKVLSKYDEIEVYYDKGDTNMYILPQKDDFGPRIVGGCSPLDFIFNNDAQWEQSFVNPRAINRIREGG